MTMNLVTVLGTYYLVVIIIGLWKYKSQTKSQYVSAPNSTGLVVLTLSLLGTIVGGGMFLGVAQIGYSGGVTAFALGVSYLVGSIIIGLLAPMFRAICKERNVTTLIGLLEVLYPSKSRFSVSVIFTSMTFVVFLLMLSAQFLSIATFVGFYMNIEFRIAIIIASSVVAVISTLLCTAFGGFTRDVWADVAQVAFITFGVFAMLSAGVFDPDLRSHLAQLPPDFFAVRSGGVIFFLFSLFFVAPTFLVRFDLWQRIVTAKTDSEARNAFVLSGVIALLFFTFFGLLGMYGRSLGLQNSEYVVLEIVQQNVTGWSYALVTAAFFAAVMSTADTFLGVTSLAFAKLTIYQDVGSLENSTNNDGQFVARLRRMTIGVGFSSLIIAYFMRDIVDVFSLAFGLLMVFLPALIAGLFREPNENAARWSSVLGLVVVVVSGVGIGFKNAFLPGVLVSVATYFIVLLWGRKE